MNITELFPVNVCEMQGVAVRWLRYGPAPAGNYEVSIKTETGIFTASGNSLPEALLRLTNFLQNAGEDEKEIRLVPMPDWFVAWETLITHGYHP